MWVQYLLPKRITNSQEKNASVLLFETKRELKIHSYTHSFTDTRTKQICENCDFESNIIETMEVHIGKCRTKDFECGFCEAKLAELENLEVT